MKKNLPQIISDLKNGKGVFIGSPLFIRDDGSVFDVNEREQLPASALGKAAYDEFEGMAAPSDVSGAISTHNSDTDAHQSIQSDIRTVEAELQQVGSQLADIAEGALFEIDNLVSNAGFENDLTGWTKNGAVSASVETTTVLNGSKAFRIDATGSNIEYYQDILMPAGHVAYCSVWAYIESYASGAPQMRVTDYNASTNPEIHTLDTSIVGEWQHLSYLRTVTGTGIRIRLLTGTDATVSVIFDCALVVDATVAFDAAYLTDKTYIDSILQETIGDLRWFSGKASNLDTVKNISQRLITDGIYDVPDDIAALNVRLSGYEPDTQAPTKGYYVSRTSGNTTANTDWQYIKVSAVAGEKMRCCVTVTGFITAMAVFYDLNDVFMAGTDINAGTNNVNDVYVDEEFVCPANTGYVAICGRADSDILLERYELFDVGENVKTNNREIISAKARLTVMENSYWYGKSIVWFGTSIPAGGNPSYPARVAAALGATLTNESLGSSMARNGISANATVDDPLGWTGVHYLNVGYSLSQTLAEKQELITNWESKWHDLVSGADRPATLDAPTQALFLDCSYETRLVSRHLGSNRKDLYVFDHGHNDILGIDLTAETTIDSTDRGTFYGAMNFLIDLILNDNPKAMIVIIGHYENARKTTVSLAQTALAEHWNINLLKLWEKLGWTQHTITTTGYWDAGVWVPSGGANQELTLTEVWMADDLHPHSDISGAALDKIANIITPWIGGIR